MQKKVGALRKFFGEFKKFITRGNVLDMSVGVIVGGAFTAIVNGMSNFILKPIINWLLALILGKDSLSGIYTMLKEAYVLDENGVATSTIDLANSIYMDWGAFINAIINFLLIAFVLFCIVRAMNRLAEANGKLKKEYEKEKKAIKKFRKEGLSRKQAVARYEAELKAAEEAKAEEERLAAETAAKAEAETAAKAEEKAMANTRLLEEIRDLLKKA